MLGQIDKRLHNEFASQAALQGIKIPIKGVTQKTEVAALTKDEEELMMKSLAEAQMRKRRRG